MKRYLLFYGINRYPKGGHKDFGGSFETPEEAFDFIKTRFYNGKDLLFNLEWASIIDTKESVAFDWDYRNPEQIKKEILDNYIDNLNEDDALQE